MNLPRTSLFFASLLFAGGCVTGCGCGDTFAARRIEIVQFGNIGTAPVEIDVSRLPQGKIEERVDKKGICGCPVTEIQMMSAMPIKLILVPATQP